MGQGRSHPGLRAWAVVVAVLLALYGVLPQAHLAWDHAHESVCDSPIVSDPGRLRLTPAEPEHPACAICQTFLAAPSLNLPEPPPAVLVPLMPVRAVSLPGDSGTVAGIEIRWSLARGPPRA
jgi:hypothetical protein